MSVGGEGGDMTDIPDRPKWPIPLESYDNLPHLKPPAWSLIHHLTVDGKDRVMGRMGGDREEGSI